MDFGFQLTEEYEEYGYEGGEVDDFEVIDIEEDKIHV